MKLYRGGEYDKAAEILFYNNPFSAITSMVCDWHKLCLGHCVLNAKNAPVRWYEIEKELSGKYLFHASVAAEDSNNGSVAIIGGGPAGITAALALREKGYGAVIYDSNPEYGGVLRYGIPEFRLDRKYIDAYESIIKEAGIVFRGNTTVGKDISLNRLREQFDAVLIAGGAGLPRRLNVPGETEGKVIYALDFLKDPDSYALGHKVIVVGGGNVTIDASRTALRKGCETSVYYRKSFENMPANLEEVSEAGKEGVEFNVFEVPVEIKEHTVVMRKCENRTDADGKISTVMIDGTDHEVVYDNIIIAISANVDHGLFGTGMPEMDDNGNIILEGTQVKSLPGIFLAGDFKLGPKTVVEAVMSAKTAVEEIDTFLKMKRLKEMEKLNTRPD
jgi:glutamate synthase (NADPH/NADH) small chain